MSDELIDQVARDRFCTEWQENFAVSANAGSGKTTAISERLAAMAQTDDAAKVLPKTAVVTFTKKAAQQIGQRARAVLLRRLSESGSSELGALDHLERAFFGTIHSFCLLLAQRYGQELGINLNPAVVAEDDERCWEEFVEQDGMSFESLERAQVDVFLRHVPLENIFELARSLDATTARRLSACRPLKAVPKPSDETLRRVLALVPKSSGKKNTELSQRNAVAWQEKWATGRGYLPLYEPVGSAGGIGELAKEWMLPLKNWLATAGAVLAAELAERYRIFRFDRGIQTYADQVDAALAVLRDRPTLERIRAEGWRVILDEAQDTDPQQFAVLVEITRAVGAEPGSWPTGTAGGRGVGPRPGHFCMVGDGQQSIYGGRADIRNFRRHMEAFGRGEGGELLSFHVTFRAPHAVIELLNESLPEAFGRERLHNMGLPAAEGAEPPYLQVDYEPLAAGPKNEMGWVRRIALTEPSEPTSGVENWITEEARQVAVALKRLGLAGLGIKNWGELCLLAPRNAWLLSVRKAFEAEGLKVALQTRQNRNGDNPVYGWIAGLMAVVCDADNAFEWFGVLRELWGISDARLAAELKARGAFQWESPEEHGPELAAALTALRPWILSVDDEGQPLGAFVRGVATTCGLAEKARALDASGALSDTLAKLLSEATELGLDGVGPREWLAELLAELDTGNPSGKAERDAINLLTSHSAKGLEWPVVLVLGLWRPISGPPETGLRLVRAEGGELHVYFDGASMPSDTKESRQREQRRELTRLLYVTLTRPRRGLLLAWGSGFGGAKAKQADVSLAALWGDAAVLERVEEVSYPPTMAAAMESSAESRESRARPNGEPAFQPQDLGDSFRESGEPYSTMDARLHVSGVAATSAAQRGGKLDTALPARVLPHQLAAHVPDRVRAVRHELTADEVLPMRDGDEALDYGLWWHETMEFMPWRGSVAEVEAYCAAAMEKAQALGCGERGRDELARLRASEWWTRLVDGRWQHQAELGVLAPLSAEAWIDGVIDLVLHDATAGEVWVLDWKTNRLRRGEETEALLARLAAEYAPQLQAYGQSMAQFFPGNAVKLYVYSTATGSCIEIERGQKGALQG